MNRQRTRRVIISAVSVGVGMWMLSGTLLRVTNGSAGAGGLDPMSLLAGAALGPIGTGDACGPVTGCGPAAPGGAAALERARAMVGLGGASACGGDAGSPADGPLVVVGTKGGVSVEELERLRRAAEAQRPRPSSTAGPAPPARVLKKRVLGAGDGGEESGAEGGDEGAAGTDASGSPVGG